MTFAQEQLQKIVDQFRHSPGVVLADLEVLSGGRLRVAVCLAGEDWDLRAAVIATLDDFAREHLSEAAVIIDVSFVDSELAKC